MLWNFTLCASHQILSERLREAGRDGRDMWHVWREQKRMVEDDPGKKNKKKFLGTLKERWEDNIRIEFKEMELDDPGYS